MTTVSKERNKTSFPEARQVKASDSNEPALSAQQKKLLSENSGKFAIYKDFVVGDKGWLYFLGFESYQLFFSNLSGVLGYGARSVIAPKLFHSCGKGLALGRGVSMRQPGSMSIGKRVVIDDYCSLDVRSSGDSSGQPRLVIGDQVFVGRYTAINARDGELIIESGCNISSHCRLGSVNRVVIGESTLIASHVYIGAGHHNFGEKGVPIIAQGTEDRGGVTIGKGSWIGARVTIVDGVTIGEGAVIGAHSFVKDDVPAGSIAVGCPAKVIREI